MNQELENYINKISKGDKDLKQHLFLKLIEAENKGKDNLKSIIYFAKKDFMRDNFVVTKIKGRNYHSNVFMKSCERAKMKTLVEIGIFGSEDYSNVPYRPNSKLDELELKDIVEIIKNELSEVEFNILDKYFLNKTETEVILEKYNIKNKNVLRNKISRILCKLKKNKDLEYYFNNINI